MHLEPAAPVYNTLPCCDSMQMSMHDVILGPGTNSRSSATWCCSPMKTWTPLSAAMRRMQVQARRIVTCVMPPVFLQAASGLWTRGRNGLERARASRNRICGSGSHQSPERNPKRYNPFDVIIIESDRSNSPPQWFSCSAFAETKKVVRLHTVQ